MATSSAKIKADLIPADNSLEAFDKLYVVVALRGTPFIVNRAEPWRDPMSPTSPI